ncbi:MAG: hypothetical protein V1779_13015 [bacterium]
MYSLNATTIGNELLRYSPTDTSQKKEPLFDENLFLVRKDNKLWAVKTNNPYSIPCKVYDYNNRTETYTEISGIEENDFDEMYIKLPPIRSFKLNINFRSIKKGTFKFIET